MKTITRRQFLGFAGGGAALLVVGSKLPWLVQNNANAQSVQSLNFHITDAMKEMATHNTINEAKCYFWIYKSVTPDLPPECPGPIIVATQGDTINVSITNDLDERHAFFIPGIYDSGHIEPGQTVVGSFTVPTAGAYLYYDNLNSPVNRVMGLHGALIVRPSAAVPGHKFTPYDNPTLAVQRLYDDFGSSAHFPGLAWEQGDPATSTPPFRQYVWLTHQASPKLFAEVGSLGPGQLYNAQQFMDAFLRDPYQPHAFHPDNPGGNRKPQYFTINGQSGHFAHSNPYITPMNRVGEPVVVHILNAGLMTHSMHLHANHFYVTCVNDVVQDNPIWVDVYTVRPLDKVDYTIPYVRIPDVPNQRGIGLPDPPLASAIGAPAYPPLEEMNTYMPAPGQVPALDINGDPIDLAQRQSPLCFPMHDHSEPSQTAQGGNYNMGLISGIYFVGDRNVPGWMDFPMDPDFQMMYGGIRGISGTGPAGPPPH